ncbi:MAG: hypothetical protein JEY99_04880 [Spirochaetales bacterium]|nr:hypothetical protein [Spirochaetales bacterium]
MKMFFKLVCMISIFLLFAACDPNGTVDGVDTGISAALVSFPDSLSSSTAGRDSVDVSDTVITHLAYLYNPVRNEFNLMAENVIEFIRDLLDSVEINVLNNDDFMAYLAENDSWTNIPSTGTKSGYLIEKGTIEGDYTLECWEDDALILYLEFTEDGNNFEGTAWVAGTETDDGIYYRADFNTDDAEYGSVTELSALNLSQDASEMNSPDRLWLKAWEKDGNFYINANIRYLRADLEDDDTFFKQYLMTVLKGSEWNRGDVFGGNYIYRCVAKTDLDQGAVSLALVPESITTTDADDIFTGYSIGEMYKKAFSAWFNATGGEYESEPEEGGYGRLIDLMTTNSSGLDFTGSELNTQGSVGLSTTLPMTLTDDQVFTYLEDFRAYLAEFVTTNNLTWDLSDFDAILFAPNIDNPGYFTSDGFVGTASADAPDWCIDFPVASGDISYSAAGIAGDVTTDEFLALFNEIIPD